MRKFFDRIVMIVELSLRVRSTVVKAANGPLTKNRIEARLRHVSEISVNGKPREEVVLPCGR